MGMLIKHHPQKMDGSILIPVDQLSSYLMTMSLNPAPPMWQRGNDAVPRIRKICQAPGDYPTDKPRRRRRASNRRNK